MNIYFILFISMQKYQIIERIGQGAYGVVLKSKTRSTHQNNSKQVVAMKQFKEADDDQNVRRTTMREVKILKMLDHPNIVQLKEAFRKKGIVYLIFEYVKNNLLEILQKSPDGLAHELIRKIIYQMCKGLAYLHSQNIIHRDIKPENILVGENNQLKICDFGFARIVKKHHKEELTDYVATRWYRPPQLLVGAPYNKQIDMWAVGCIMGELIDGNPMFPGQNELDQLFLIQKCLGTLTTEHNQIFLKNPRYIGSRFPQIHSLETIDKRYLGKFNPKGLSLMKQLLKMDPSERLTADQALDHPFFQGMKQLEQQTLRRKSNNNYMQSQGRPLDRQQLHLTTGIHTGVHQKRKQSHLYNQKIQDRQKTEYYNPYHENIFNVTKNQKNNPNKKKKDELSVGTKGTNNYKSTSMANKGLAKNKQSRISQQKVARQRENATKTQAGFYVIGGGIIPQRNEQQYSNEYDHHMIHVSHNRNKIYNIKSPRSKQQARKSNKTHQKNTQQVHQEDENWQSTNQLPILMMASQKSSENRGHKHAVVTGQPVPNIIITNSSFHYRHH